MRKRRMSTVEESRDSKKRPTVEKKTTASAYAILEKKCAELENELKIIKDEWMRKSTS